MSQEYNDGIAFRFEMPNEDLSLRGVCIEEDQPVLLFDVAKKVPTLTEQEVAMSIRVVNDNEVPEFFYCRFLPGHPFADRHFKHYKPLYMRRTPMGENLAEIDWNMKCLSIDVRADKTRKNFSSWSENSNIDGLKSIEHFLADPTKPHGVYMKCKSVSYYKDSNQFLFDGEPEMMIDYESRQSYSNYITEHLDSVAYYDEPLFLKMKEYIKLNLVVEWLKEKGIHFSQEWIQEQTQPTLEPPKPLQVVLSPEQRNSIIKRIKKGVIKAVEEPHLKQMLPSSKYKDRISATKPVIEVDNGCFEAKYERTFPDPAFESTGLYVPVVQKVVARATTHDFDFLYSDIDPNEPVILDHTTHKPVIPNVKKWSELLVETEVFPCKWWQDPNDIMRRSPALTGGVSTASMPHVQRVQESVPVKNPCPVKVPASKRKIKKIVHSRDVPLQRTVQAPPSTASATSSAVMPASACNIKYGYETGVSSSGMSNGEKITEPPLYTSTKITQLIGGKEVGPPLDISLHLCLPPRAEVDKDDSSSIVSDSGISSATVTELDSDDTIADDDYNDKDEGCEM